MVKFIKFQEHMTLTFNMVYHSLSFPDQQASPDSLTWFSVWNSEVWECILWFSTKQSYSSISGIEYWWQSVGWWLQGECDPAIFAWICAALNISFSTPLTIPCDHRFWIFQILKPAPEITKFGKLEASKCGNSVQSLIWVKKLVHKATCCSKA